MEPVGHRAVTVWQERRGEISWQCSCGTVNKHFKLPVAALKCAGESDEIDAPRERVFRNVKKG